MFTTISDLVPSDLYLSNKHTCLVRIASHKIDRLRLVDSSILPQSKLTLCVFLIELRVTLMNDKE